MINIESSKCVSCCNCIKVCSYGTGNIKLNKKAYIISQDCPECGQCISVCPTGAITWDISTSKRFDFNISNLNKLNSGLAVLDIIKSRRSIRSYTDRIISKKILNNIIEAAQYAPTANNDRSIKIKVIQNCKNKLLEIIILTYKIWIENNSEDTVIKFFRGNRSYLNKWKKIISEYINNAKDLLFFEAPDVIIIVGDSYYLIDSGIIAENMVLTAKDYNLGSCYIGFVKKALQLQESNMELFEKFKYMFSDCQYDLKQFLNIESHQSILVSFTLGYPSVNYLYEVAKKKLEIDFK